MDCEKRSCFRCLATAALSICWCPDPVSCTTAAAPEEERERTIVELPFGVLLSEIIKDTYSVCVYTTGNVSMNSLSAIQTYDSATRF